MVGVRLVRSSSMLMLGMARADSVLSNYNLALAMSSDSCFTDFIYFFGSRYIILIMDSGKKMLTRISVDTALAGQQQRLQVYHD
jgi:hypothetical protein